ncbi:hypothetical protein GGR58DRAFT_455754 [Xylaria digitata]|nr:hypothetical protein GGR58DRAFT_455754 [Xylaria digitata]
MRSLTWHFLLAVYQVSQNGNCARATIYVPSVLTAISFGPQRTMALEDISSRIKWPIAARFMVSVGGIMFPGKISLFGVKY